MPPIMSYLYSNILSSTFSFHKKIYYALRVCVNRIVMSDHHRCFMGKISEQADPILERLDKRAPEDWMAVGRVIADLERISRASEAGQPWQNVVADRLRSLGQKMSTGHLHKLRRVSGFLDDSVRDLGTSDAQVQAVKLTSAEMAERLFRLDEAAGHAALQACLRPGNPANLAEIKEMYDRFVTDHPERMNPRQASWAARKSTEEPAETSRATQVTTQDDTRLRDNRSLKQIFAEMERDVLAHVARLEAALDERNLRIRELEEDLVNTNLALQQALQDYERLATDTRDMRADRHGGH